MDRQLERSERAEHARRFLQFASSFYVTPLFMVFAVADYIWYPQFFYSFLTIRLIATVTGTILMRVFMPRSPIKYIEVWASLFVATCLWPIHIMIFKIGEPSTPYYAGLVLVIMGLSSGLRVSWPYYAFNLAQTLIPYFVFGALNTQQGLQGHFYLNFLFMLSITLIVSVSRGFAEELHRVARKLRSQLSDEIVSRDQIISNKTAEALELHALSRQFSPQIISSLGSGGLNLVDKIHRSEICTVFVDIVGSTNKFISLDRDDLQKILSMYMEDVMGIFLKYDITIDKFLGDGVLAFSNDPIPYPDYIERVLRASLEIKHRIATRRLEYMRYWLGEFEISFGIATGHASVGFYGSDLHVKSYTAIGRVVNLAARLGSLAGPNEILVSQDVIEKLRAGHSDLLNSIEMVPQASTVLKGFENDPVAIFRMDAKDSTSVSLVTSDLEHCPRGHGLLFLAQDRNGIYFFKCRHCDFVLSEDGTSKVAA